MSFYAGAQGLIEQVHAEGRELLAQRDEAVAALGIAEATIERLERHAPGSANGTLDVIRAAIAKAQP